MEEAGHTKEGNIWTASFTNSNTTPGLPNITDLCPGVEWLLNKNSTGFSILQVNVSDCGASEELPDYTAAEGVVYSFCSQSASFCKTRLEVPRGMFAHIRIQRLSLWSLSSQWETRARISSSQHVSMQWFNYQEVCFLNSDDNKGDLLHLNKPLVKIQLEAVKRQGSLMKYHSQHRVFVIVPYLEHKTSVHEDIHVAPGNVLLVSIHQSTPVNLCQSYFKISIKYRKQNASRQSVVHLCRGRTEPAYILDTHHLQIEFLFAASIFEHLNMSFSGISADEQPHKLPSGLFNCSVPYYSKFSPYLDCNLKTECEEGGDETGHCFFSSPDCGGWVASRSKCFMSVSVETPFPLQTVAFKCLGIGGRLALMKTQRDVRDSLPLFHTSYNGGAHVGYVQGWEDTPFMYSRLRKWSDNTMIYYMTHAKQSDYPFPSRTVLESCFLPLYRFDYSSVKKSALAGTAMCERKRPVFSVLPSQIVMTGIPSAPTDTHQPLVQCPDHQSVHPFLICDSKTRCRNVKKTTHVCPFSNLTYLENNTLDKGMARIPSMYALFPCHDDVDVVPYTLVCDFQQDCADNSDESFCQHQHGKADDFLCSNGQYVPWSQLCNQYSDCVDDSDEKVCPDIWWQQCAHCVEFIDRVNSWEHRPLYLSLDGSGYFTHHVMASSQSCPDSQYLCMSEPVHCLPIYTRCNGFSDCTDGEDEQDCDSVTCPGLYQCRASTVCVHGDHLCDGWGQCPQRDDELMCDMITCPEGCLCEGHTFLCTNPFLAEAFPLLRYLDATGSGMSLDHFSSNAYLVYLSLSHCSINTVSPVNLPNVQHINLADNSISAINMSFFCQLPNLQILQMRNNPLSQIHHLKQVLFSLTKVDLSYTHLKNLSDGISAYLPNLRHLNLSFSAIQTIGTLGFKTVPRLVDLHLRGNLVLHFPFHLFTELKFLKRVFASNYRLCCQSMLPEQSETIECETPYVTFPSCSTLIPSDVHSIFFWLLGILASFGNVVCFTIVRAIQNKYSQNFVTSVGHLQLANICMGCHVSIALVADHLYEGQYLEQEKNWTSSLTCKVSGFLSLLAGQVSLLILWFIVLDHVLLFWFSSRPWACNKSSSAAVCAVVWCVGALLSLVPFLPGLSHWGLHGQSGLCRLALYDHHADHEEFKWFTVITVVNFLVSLMIVAGQIAVFRQTPKYRAVMEPAKKLYFPSAHLTERLVVTNTFCWIVLGLVAVMLSQGVAVFKDVHHTLVVFLLPFHSALNPLLTVWSVLADHRHQAQEQRLIARLKLNLSQKAGPRVPAKT